MFRSILIVALSFVTAGSTLAVVAPDPVYEVGVSGMHCKGCGREAKALIEKIANVKSVEIDVKAQKATVTMNASTTLDRATIETALKGSKFAVTSFTAPAPESKPKG